MAAPGKASRWGSLLSQAVAGVESRLDTMLAESDEDEPNSAAAGASAAAPSRTATTDIAGKQPVQVSAPAAIKAGVTDSRSSSRNRANDRLQARLAQALAGKASAANAKTSRTTSSPRSSTDQASRPSIEQQRAGTNNDSVVAKQDDVHSEVEGAESNDVSSRPESSDIVSAADNTEACPTAPPKPNPNTATTEAENDNRAIEQEEHVSQGTDEARLSLSEQNFSVLAANDEIQSELTKELQDLKDRHQEEIREHLERIDSLESKLQYLSKTATETAKTAVSSAPSGSPEQKLAEKDEKIALLMEEGQKLSANEHKLRTTAKKLRALLGENEKQLADLKTKRDKAISDAEALRSRLDGSEEAERRQEEANRVAASLRKEIDSLKRDNSKKDDAHRRSELEWKKKMEQAETSHRDALNKALAAERQKQKALEEANSALSAEKEAAAEQARQDEIEWREKLERAHERARKTENELKAELLAVEGKLEAMRVAAEEASAGNGGEAQVKMFRQMETLQSQYTSARENWQGIEASLIAKSTGLEKERDEAQRRESEMRKKARDAAVRLRNVEDELHDVQPALTSTRQELTTCRDEMAKLQASYKSCEASLAEAREELDKLKQGLNEKAKHEGEEEEGLEEESVEAQRRQWVDEVAGATTHRGHQSRPGSPPLSISRTFSSELLGLGLSGPGKSRRSQTPGSVPDNNPLDILSPQAPSSLRRFTGQPVIRTREPSYAGSTQPPAPFSPFEAPSESGQFPSFTTATERENGTPIPEIVPSCGSARHQDMISVSTVAAGPSVQLVERMSAAIRRLEAEKVTAKEEMARVCGQRDEARTDLVALMKQMEETKAAASRVPNLEHEVASLDARYQTTLEMLGEKSELVEELRADVEDVKAMYRELVERTVK
ncbi:hypothetical protein E4U13_002105 [Claviceps humidiphila]|uniref:TATA element modulatory factor 1 TATA binding domain-containing protein n=1 Tax=Claviceps humidiphila TaxID=1294629 RepID=A0A9P7Q9N6_9HYPO|nr:hypothetical protein E4U13_002105 [Claviceps humidiphila]